MKSSLGTVYFKVIYLTILGNSVGDLMEKIKDVK